MTVVKVVPISTGSSTVAVVASPGPTGAEGPQGPQGPTGTAGAAATIDVGTVTTGAAGSSVIVTNVGTSSAAVFDFSIPQGDAGTNGTAATISVGSVTTGAPGSSATVTNAGTSGAAIFDFSIPQGDTGATGATGATGPAPWTLIGAYDNGYSYNLGDAVTYQGGFYYRTGNPLNPGYPPTPGSINASWTPVADRGEQGIQGIQGIQGNTGPQGATGNVFAYTINSQTGVSYTAQSGDEQAIIRMNNGSPNVVYIPTNTTWPVAIGSSITVVRTGSGSTKIQATTPGTTTIVSTGATAAQPAARAQYSFMTAVKVESDVWYVTGDIS